MSVGLLFTLMAMASIPVASANGYTRSWQGQSTATADCNVFGLFASAGTMTVYWFVQLNLRTNTYSWTWYTVYSWNSYCTLGSIQQGQGCAGPLVSETISQPNSGSGSSYNVPPHFTVAPVSVAVYDLLCYGITGFGGGNQDFYMQAVATIQT